MKHHRLGAVLVALEDVGDREIGTIGPPCFAVRTYVGHSVPGITILNLVGRLWARVINRSWRTLQSCISIFYANISVSTGNLIKGYTSLNVHSADNTGICAKWWRTICGNYAPKGELDTPGPCSSDVNQQGTNRTADITDLWTETHSTTCQFRLIRSPALEQT